MAAVDDVAAPLTHLNVQIKLPMYVMTADGNTTPERVNSRNGPYRGAEKAKRIRQRNRESEADQIEEQRKRSGSDRETEKAERTIQRSRESVEDHAEEQRKRSGSYRGAEKTERIIQRSRESGEDQTEKQGKRSLWIGQ